MSFVSKQIGKLDLYLFVIYLFRSLFVCLVSMVNIITLLEHQNILIIEQWQWQTIWEQH